MLPLDSFLLSIAWTHGLGNTSMSDQERFWTTVFVAVLFGTTFGFLIYRSIVNRKVSGDTDSEWDEGLIPLNFRPTKENIFEVFIAASCAIVVRDLDHYYMKFPYIDKYLRKNFGETYYYAESSYDYSMRHVVRINSLADWSNRNLAKVWKVRMINFLAGIAAYDGGINDEEQRYLLTLMAKLNLELTDFEAIYQEKLTRKNERKYQASSNTSDREFFYTVLGLEITASIEEVKTAYRKLVKLTHPDRFANETPEVQKQMSEKFRKVQEAYESIVNS